MGQALTILLSSIVMGAIYSVYRVQTHSMKVQENRMEAQEYARSVLDLMVTSREYLYHILC